MANDTKITDSQLQQQQQQHLAHQFCLFSVLGTQHLGIAAIAAAIFLTTAAVLRPCPVTMGKGLGLVLVRCRELE